MKPHGGGGNGGGLQTHRFLRRCASRRRNLVPFALLGIIFLAMNPTVGRLWRGTRRCAGENWARVGDHTYELGESLLTLQALGFHPSAVLDIGANEGNWARSIHEKLPAASIFMIEGNQALEKILQPAAAEIGMPYRIAIVGDEEKEVTFNIMCDGGPCSGGSSVFQENTKYGAGERTETRHMTTIDNIVKEAGVGPFQMIKLDVQGAEMLALKGATETLRTIDVIVTETSNVEYNKGAPETLEILNFMDRLGFKIFDITETHRKPLRSGEDSHAGGSGVLFQLDFLFVRKTSPLLKEAEKYVFDWTSPGG